MCGICGIYDKQNTSPKQELQAMADEMGQRGPDDSGMALFPGIGLAHRRLSIIDLTKKGRQPMKSASGRYLLVFNGEIYNYEKLRKEHLKDAKFRSSSDSEVLLMLYEKYGKNCLQYLRGQFAFAIYDTKKEEFFLARDRIGEKPLYYHQEGDRFYFASTLPALLKCAAVPRELDLTLLNYLFLGNFRHIPDPHCIFRGVKKLPPASFLIIRKGRRAQSGKYWVPSFKKSEKTHEQLVEEYKTLLQEVVERETVASDVPVGMLISGGVDSTSVALYVPHRERVNSYTVGDSETDEEFLRAREVAKQLGFRHHEFIFRENHISYLVEMVQRYGEPFALYEFLYVYHLSEEIAKKQKVVLSGNGGDELFYGYPSANRLFLLSRIFQLYDKLPSFVRSAISSGLKIANLASLPMPSMFTTEPHKRKGEYYRKLAERTSNYFAEPLSRKMLHHDYGGLIDGLCAEVAGETLFVEQSYYSTLLLDNQHTVTIQSDLPGMCESIEIRSPLLDHKMAEFAFSVPVEYKIDGYSTSNRNKKIMREAIEGPISKKLLYAKKIGLGDNIRKEDILRQKSYDFVVARLAKLKQRKVFKDSFIEHMLKDFDRGEFDFRIIFALLTIEIWFSLFVDGIEPKELVAQATEASS